MQQIVSLARGLASPAILMVVVWCAALIGVAFGPIDYPMQPSPAVLALVAAGVSLFILAHWGGAWFFAVWFRQRPNCPAPSHRVLNRVVIASSLLGIGGIGLIALDRLVLSGISNGGYAELLRCAPGLIDFIEVKRTPFLYVGYLAFSFGFASLVLLLLKGEEIRGVAAVLAQLSIVSPVGYALLYSGRMPILFVIVLILSAVLVRCAQERRPLPQGHHLFIKMVLVVVVFAIYSSAIWSSRQKFCVQMNGLIQELQQKMKDRDLRSKLNGSLDTISAADLSRMVDDKKALPAASPINAAGLLAIMRDAWQAAPRSYVIATIDSGRLSPRTAMSFLNTYFYLTHGVRVIDTTWRARERFSPNWGVYEIGILSPVLRVFFPHSDALADMGAQLKAADIVGFFPTVWAAAYIDFGFAGAVIYVLIWGFAAGWSACGARRSAFATPSLLLVFILASILLSPVQGPLGIANSALVLFSMLVTGVAIDLVSLRTGARKESREPRAGALA